MNSVLGVIILSAACARQVASYFIDTNPPGLFEGDMKGMTREKLNRLNAEEEAFQKASGILILDPSYHWPGARVPYRISSRFSSSYKRVIEEAMEELERKTCAKFTPRTSKDSDYLYITRESGCWSYTGRQQSGEQKLSLGSGCVRKGIVQHELMHALGIRHEHTRSDRDNYVKVHWENIKDGREHNFEKSGAGFSNLGTSYDSQSIMHYSGTAFSKNDKPTMTALNGQKLGGNLDLTDTDLQHINRLYKCNGGGSTTTESPSTTTSATPGGQVVIATRPITNWGKWSVWDNCKAGNFAFAAKVRAQKKQGSGDDTALNTIRLICGKNRKRSNRITGKAGFWGDWLKTKKCSRSAYINGFRLNAEAPQGRNGDDTAANSIEFSCSDGRKLTGLGVEYGWGKWSSWRKCPAGMAVCAMQTQVESKQRKGDDTALNNVKFKCCKM